MRDIQLKLSTRGWYLSCWSLCCLCSLGTLCWLSGHQQACQGGFDNWGHYTPLRTGISRRCPCSSSGNGSLLVPRWDPLDRWIRSSYVGSLLQVLRLYPQERPAGWRTGGSLLLLASSQQSRLSLQFAPLSPSISTGTWWQCTWRGSGDLWCSSQGSLRISSWCYYNSSEDCS